MEALLRGEPTKQGDDLVDALRIDPLISLYHPSSDPQDPSEDRHDPALLLDDRLQGRLQ